MFGHKSAQEFAQGAIPLIFKGMDEGEERGGVFPQRTGQKKSGGINETIPTGPV